MDLYGRISDPAEIQFSIKAPFYKSWYAYVFYGLVFLIGLFLIRKLRLLELSTGRIQGIPAHAIQIG